MDFATGMQKAIRAEVTNGMVDMVNEIARLGMSSLTEPEWKIVQAMRAVIDRRQAETKSTS